MATGQIVTNYRAEYSENLLNNYSTFSQILPIYKTGGSAFSLAQYINKPTFVGNNCISSYNDSNVDTLFYNFGSELKAVIKSTGKHIFSFKIMHFNTVASDDLFTINIFVNGVATHSIVTNLLDFVDKNVWLTSAQSFTFNAGSVITFSFEHKTGTSTPKSNSILYFDALKLEFDDRLLGTPTIYSLPLPEQKTGWQSRSDTANIVSLTGATENVLVITGTAEQNGGLTLLDANSKVIPSTLNSFIVVDFACTFETPSGSNNSVDVFLKVGTDVYRGFTYLLTKVAGVDDLFSASFALPCGPSVIANGAQIVLKPNVTLNFKNRYISASQTHKGI